MRVAIDARAYRWAGVGRYVTNLVRELVQLPDGPVLTLLVGRDDLELVQGRFAGLKAGERLRYHVVDGSYYSLREQTALVRQLGAVEADLWHFTHFNVPLLFGKPYVVTIHDIIRFIFPGQTQQTLLRQLAYELVFQRAVVRARALVAVSETTLRDLRALPLRLCDRQHVVYEGVAQEVTSVVSADERQQARLLVGSTDPYLLYVGVWMSHKNLRRIVAAFRRVLAQRPDCRLVLTGKPKPGHVQVDRFVERLGIPADRVVYLGFVKHEHLSALYAGAACLLLPSLYEGFGLPALEAAAAGCPVVAATAGSLPEVMGEAALYVNPESEEAIAGAALRLLSDDALRQRLIVDGRAQAGLYSWQECAKQTLEVYKDVLS